MKKRSKISYIVCILLLVISFLYVPDLIHTLKSYKKHKEWLQISTIRNENLSRILKRAMREQEMRKIVVSELPYSGANHYIEIRLHNQEKTDANLYLVPYEDSGILLDIKKL